MNNLSKIIIASIISSASLIGMNSAVFAGETGLNREVCKFDKRTAKISYQKFLRRHPSCSPAAAALAYTGVQAGMTVKSSHPHYLPRQGNPNTPATVNSLATIDRFTPSIVTQAPAGINSVLAPHQTISSFGADADASSAASQNNNSAYATLNVPNIIHISMTQSNSTGVDTGPGSGGGQTIPVFTP